MSDNINHPPHYTHSDIEPINVIESWGLGFHLGNALKYIARAGHKGDTVEDLRKAHWYIARAIEMAKEATQKDSQVVGAHTDTIDCFECGQSIPCEYAGTYYCSKCGQKYWINKV
jgi:hypothetical protein